VTECRVLLLCNRLAKAVELERTVGHAAIAAIAPVDGETRRRFLLALLRDAVAHPLGAIRVLRRAILSLRPYSANATVRRIAGLRPDVGLHAIGDLYRRPLLDVFRVGVVNAHIGLLPRYRGRSVLEWSVLNGDTTGVTAFLVDEGIDTGPIIFRRVVDLRGFADLAAAKRHLFGLDGEIYVEALELLRGDGFVPEPQEAAEGKRHYVMSGLFAGVANELFAARDAHLD
jgi:Formyl transferase